MRIYKRDNLDELFFNRINTEAKAYFLGLLFADGNISDAPLRQKRLAISLLISDLHIIETFKRYLNSKCKISTVTHDFHGLEYNYCRIAVSSNILCNSLINHGCVPRKSLILKFPTTVPEHLMRHFVRGLFDGDGCINIHVEKGKTIPRFSFGITGTYDICNGVNLLLNKELGLNIRKIKKQKSVFGYDMNGGCQIEKLYHYLYDNCNPELYLIRKHNKFKQILNYSHKPIIKTSKYKNVCKAWKKWAAEKYTTYTHNRIGLYATEFEAYIGLCKYEEEHKLPFANDPTDYFNYLAKAP